MKDYVVFSKKNEALDFYIECLTCGIMAKWNGISVNKDTFDTFYTVEVDVEKTIELKNKKEV